MKNFAKIFQLLLLVWIFRETNSQADENYTNDINDEFCGKCPAGYERDTRPRPNEGGNGPGGSYDRCGRCVKIDQSCANGYYPDGNDCKMCNCPGPSYDRQFGSSCFRDVDGYPTCTGCKPGTTGRNCEKCTPGSIQNSYYPYDCQIRNDSALCPMGRCPQIYPPKPNQPCQSPGGCDSNYNYVSNYNYRPQNCYGCPSSCLGCGNNCSPNTCSSSCMNCENRNFPSCPPQTVCPPIPPPPRPWPCPPSRPCPPINVIQPPPCPSYNCTRCPDVTCPGPPDCNPCPAIPPCPDLSCPDCKCPGRCPDPCPSCNCNIGNGTTVIIQQNITLNIPCLCDPRGTDEAVGWNCMCKNNVAGARCNKCQPGYFGLRLDNQNGCSKCYCSGVTDQCESAKYFYSPIFANIAGGNHGFVLTDRMDEYPPGGFRDQELWYSYPRESEYTDKILYWRLPSKFLGNRVTSYGGVLKFSSRFVNSDRDQNGVNNPDIILIGGGNALYWTCRKAFSQNYYKDFEVALNEDSNWLSLRDNMTSRASRYAIMDVLVNLEQILIRASHSTNMRETYLRNVSLESVSSIGWANRVSIEIEKCLCPTGYSGLSCESCGPGYYRDNTGTDDKRPALCKLCPCSRKTSLGCYLSDSDKIVCKCKPSYSGHDCKERETLSVSLNPSDVFDCMNREITFTCTFQSSLDLTFEFGTNLQEVVPSLINGSLSKSTRQIKISLTRYLTELTCRILNTQGRTIAQVTSTIVISQESDCIPPITPSPNFIYINIQPSTQICINLGENKNIICNATTPNNQNLQVFWSREGDITGRFRRGITAGASNRVNILRITNAQAEDQGGFTCSATDGISVFSQTVTFSIRNLNRTSPYEQNDDPSIAHEPFDESKSAQLPVVDRIREYYDNYEREREKKVAQTLPAEIDPSVQITYESYNNSVNKPTVKITPSSSHMARVGQRVYFECEADGEPTPSVTWSRLLMNGVESTVLLASTPNAVFEISPATKADQGKYTCTAHNSFGSDQKSLQLIIMDPIVCDLNLEYPCKSGDQCILRSNRCDGIKNCKDHSDEHLCQRRTRHLRNFLRQSHKKD